jgi:hypothetical protein
MRRLALAALVLVLAGCGGGGEPGVSDPGAATTDVPRTGTVDGATTQPEDDY